MVAMQHYPHHLYLLRSLEPAANCKTDLNLLLLLLYIIVQKAACVQLDVYAASPLS